MTDSFPGAGAVEGVAPTLSPDHPLLRDLNPEQRRAVTLPPTHALVLAGAGSGKTRVLTTRIAWLLATGQASPGGILAVTFTNKAAKEMLARLTALLPLNVRGMWIGTFHGLCHRLLRAHHQLAGLPATFQILDTQDQLSAIKRLLKALHIDEEHVRPKELQWFIAGAKEDGLRPRDLAARDEDTRRKIDLYRQYEEQCQREGVVDFGELMLRSYELLRDHEPLRVHYQRRFRHLLIDEFQDTNRLQYAWIKQLAGDESGGQFVPCGNAVMAVGDDDQSIYAFRGARVGNMSDFVREFGIAEPIKLEQNYRSVGHILHAANHLIDHNRQRLGKNLRTEQGEGDRLRVAELPSDHEEAQWVVDEIRQLHRRDGVPLHQIALLYRSNAQSRALESALFNAGIAYRVYGGLRFFERAEIKHALAYLRLLENPHDDTSFLRVVNVPPRGIGARTVEQLQQAARDAGCSLHDAVTAVGGRGGAALGAFVARLDVMRERSVGRPLREIIEGVLDGSGLIDHYRGEREGAERIENLLELVNAAESFVSQEGFGRDAVALPVDETVSAPDVPAVAPSGVEAETGETLSPLAAFLAHAALEAGEHQAQAGQEAVQLMTVHAAKGLEFDCVFITGLEEGLFPHENSLSSQDGLEEERRLMYVAITRARRRLYLTHAQTRLLHGQTRYHIPSRFLDELPAESLQWLSPPRARGAGGFGGGWASSAQPAWGRSGLGGDRPAGMAGIPAAVPVPTRSAPAVSASGAEIRTGMAVFHTKFGEGRVLAIEGQGNDARAQVDFRRHGTKWLALAVAKLTPVE
ncbi:UvrD-helicase domain-containing protein [Tepidimonas sp.]|uniref:UvrD-helicase domain-containing protein n=1 Tax=Tepidimonas sp. TaxID=2002775 RepID=UPI0028CC116B|nr:UvrD-helicase domain-containing protein [Tepidimonas sp.]MDT7928092.1 3'-5' exonuclease [Tepidimonas sp.]